MDSYNMLESRAEFRGRIKYNCPKRKCFSVAVGSGPIIMAAMAITAANYGHSVTLAGGDFSMELFRGGWNRQRPSIFATSEKPELVRQIYGAFLDSGVEIILTDTAAANSIQGSLLKLGPGDLSGINRAAAGLCRSAVDQYPTKDRSAWGAIGPVEPLLTLGEITEAELSAAYREQSIALAEGGAQGIICSRFTELEALRIAIESAASATRLPAIAGVSLGSGPDFGETPLGVSVAQVCAVLKDRGLLAFAADCHRHPDGLGQVIAAIKANTDLPIWVTCDAGYLQLDDGGLSYSDLPSDFAARFKAIAGMGVNFFEGGRGVGCSHMSAVHAARTAHKPLARKPSS